MNSLQMITGSLKHMAYKTKTPLAESFLNCDMLILLDNSGSMQAIDSGYSRRIDIAQAHLNRLQETYQGKIALVCFADNVEFSPGGIILPVGTTTALTKALEFAAFADGCGLKIVVISEVQPNNPEAALTVAKTYHNKIDTIFCGPEGGDGYYFLQKLAAATGGTALTSQSPGELLKETEALLLAA